jgi:hypothetical protein
VATNPEPAPAGDQSNMFDGDVIAVPPESDQTFAMQVANLRFLLERLGEDCGDQQYLRELTMNSLEADAQNIIWDVDWKLYEGSGRTLYKLCCIDDGHGMSAREMVQHINNLSSSGGVQAMDANFGIGAKISAATRNPAGVIYQSWQGGKGTMIHLWRDPSTGESGLKQFRLSDGSYTHVVPLADTARPDVIGEHGTKVTLLGIDDNDDTVTAPEGVPTPSRWFARYLNARFLNFPDGVTVRAREGWTYDPEDTDRNVLRRVRGMREFLTEHAEHAGVVDLTDCLVYWWILDDSEKRRKTSELPNTGHFGALYQGELYEMTTGRGGTARLQQFGVLFGPDRVVLYVEPKNGPERPLSANTARTQLLLRGVSLPYGEWAHEFRSAENFPQEIRDYMDSVIAGTTGVDNSESIMERLKAYVKLFRLSRYRSQVGGPLRAGERVSGGRQTGESTSPTETVEREPAAHKPGSQTGDLLASMLAADGDEATALPPTEPLIPNVVWLSASEGASIPDLLDDRAALYLPDDNLIQANGDFRVYTDMADYWSDEYGMSHGNEIIVAVVHEWFQQALVETVLGAQALQGERRWSPKDMETILSPEALTAAVMQRYHVANAVKRTLGAKIGSLRDKAGA